MPFYAIVRGPLGAGKTTISRALAARVRGGWPGSISAVPRIRIAPTAGSAPLAAFKTMLPSMIRQGDGRIVNISSITFHLGIANLAHYVASKGGVIGLTRALALELAPHGITVNTIPPGMIDTPMLRRAETGGDVGKIEKVAARMIPVGRAGTPEDIAAVCGFLCSDEAAYVTGQVIGVNGGMVL